MTRAEWDGLSTRARERAFTVSGMADVEVIRDVWTAIDHSIAEGRSFKEFQRAIRPTLEAAWAGTVEDPGRRIETIYRTNVQSAHAAGRWRQLRNPAVRASHPYLRFDAILDNRVTEVCFACNKTIRLADDPFWQTHVPPLHFNCRSAVVPLTAEKAAALGITEDVPTADADKGFGVAPDVDTWTPDLSQVPPPLKEALDEKQAARRQATHTPENWRRAYDHFGEAAGAVAWGRAAEERGLDLTLDELDDRLPNLRFRAVAEALAHAVRLRGEHPEVATLRDALAKTTDTTRRGELRLGAALVAHHADIAPSRTIGLVPKLPPRNPRRGLAKQELDATLGRLTALVDQSLMTGPVTLSFSDKRAFFTPQERHISASYRPRVVDHEFGHALEELNPRLLRRAAAFLHVRTREERARTLREVTRISGYAKWEVCRPDAFFSPYIGKLYVRGDVTFATEVTSMALEHLDAPEAGAYMTHDPEHFYFLLGQLAGEKAS